MSRGHWARPLGRFGDLVELVIRALLLELDVNLPRIPTSTNSLRAMEVLGALLRAAGLTDRTIALGFDQLTLYVCAHAFEDGLSQTQE